MSEPLTAEQVAAGELRKLEPAKPMPPPAAPQTVNVYQARKVQTIERTGKKWKAWMLLGGLTMIVSGLGACGLTLMAGAGSITVEPARVAVVVAALGFIFGLASYVVGRLGGWWCHG